MGASATTARIAVLGASGYLGRYAAEYLEKSAGVELLRVSRRGPVKLDTQRPETFDALKGCDVVLDLTDATTARPDLVAAYCAREGITFLEATSDAPAVERLATKPTEGPGLVVLGAGIFTGVSNLMSADVAKRVANPTSLQWSVSSSLYSGAGEGTIALMLDAMGQPVTRYENGARVSEALGEGPRVRFIDATRRTLRMCLAEGYMLHRSTGVPTAEALFAPRPGFLVSAFTMLPRSWLAAAWFRAFMGAYFRVLRKVLLGWKASRVEMTATAKGSDGGAKTVHLAAEDGMRAGGISAAAIALCLAKRRRAGEERKGVCCVDEVLGLDEVLAQGDALAGGAKVYERRDE